MSISGGAEDDVKMLIEVACTFSSIFVFFVFAARNSVWGVCPAAITPSVISDEAHNSIRG